MKLANKSTRSTDDQYLLRNSERSSYRRCRWRWWQAWVEQWTPKIESVPLRFGSLVHEALGAYYIPGIKRGPDPAGTFVSLYDEQLEFAGPMGMWDEDGEWESARTLGEDMLERYIIEYGADEHIEILGPEQPFQVDLKTRDNIHYLVTPVGTFDAVIRDLRNGKVGLFEHKTAKSIGIKHLTLDEQAGTYWALAGPWLRKQGVLKRGEEIDMILYNFLRKATGDDRPKDEEGHFLNKDGTISKRQPPPYFVRQPVFRGRPDSENLLWRLRAQAWEMDQARSGKLPIYKNPTWDCSWDCAFADVCELHETGSDWKEMRRMTMTKWDPYDAHLEERDIPPGVR